MLVISTQTGNESEYPCYSVFSNFSSPPSHPKNFPKNRSMKSQLEFTDLGQIVSSDLKSFCCGMTKLETIILVATHLGNEGSPCEKFDTDLSLGCPPIALWAASSAQFFTCVGFLDYIYIWCVSTSHA